MNIQVQQILKLAEEYYLAVKYHLPEFLVTPSQLHIVEDVVSRIPYSFVRNKDLAYYLRSMAHLNASVIHNAMKPEYRRAYIRYLHWATFRAFDDDLKWMRSDSYKYHVMNPSYLPPEYRYLFCKPSNNT